MPRKLWACQGKTASQDGSREVAPQISCLSSGSRVLRKPARDLCNYTTIFPWDHSLGARELLQVERFRRNSSPATSSEGRPKNWYVISVAGASLHRDWCALKKFPFGHACCWWSLSEWGKNKRVLDPLKIEDF